MIDWKKHDNAVEASVLYRDSFGKTVAQRVVRRPTQKTVADAVTGKQIDISEMREGMTVKCLRADSGCYKVGSQYLVGRDKDGYFGPLNGKGLASLNHQAYSFELIEDGGQEGEKWTHTDTDGEPCNILIDAPDSLGRVIILRRNGWYMPVDRSNLKPIKPTISEDAKRQLELYVQYRVDKYGDYAMKSDLSDYMSHHDII